MNKKGREFLVNFCLLLLFPSFFILHGINENFGLIPLSICFKLFFTFIFVAAGIYIVSFFFFKEAKKNIIFSFYILTVYFFFGTLQDILKKRIQVNFLVSYSFLLPVILLVSLLTFFLIKRSHLHFKKTALYLSYLLIILTVWEIVIFIYNNATSNAVKNNLLTTNHIVNRTDNHKIENLDKPDIFFIVLDEYASSQSLLSEFNYNNKLDSLLTANGFYISSLSKSNYNITPFSISSTLNLNYLKLGLEKDEISKKQLLQAVETLKNNWLVQFLKSNGYNIINYSPFDFKSSPSKTQSFFYTDYFSLINNQTLYGRIRKDIWWNFSTRDILTGKFKVPESYLVTKKYHLYRNSFNWNSLMGEIAIERNSPRFVYAHLILPHGPFFLDSSGKEASDTSIIKGSYNAKEKYINQVAYANKLLQQLFPKAVSKNKRARVIIIEGDHGYRSFDQQSFTPDKTFMNFNAYYFSDKDYNQLYKSISPVNSFRVVLNKYFSQSFPILKDSSIYLNDTTLMYN